MNIVTSQSNTTQRNKNAALAAALGQLEKQFGKGSVMSLGGNTKVDADVVSTGSMKLDRATGIGGFPLGRLVEIYGPESCGKSTLALETIAQAQKGGSVCAFLDVEHALDPAYAKNLGLNTDQLYISQPDTAEQALDTTEILVNSGAVDVIVIDSVAALVPKVELEGQMGDNALGVQSRLMSQACRKLVAAIKKSNCLVIFINQIRHKIGGYGNPEVTTGGNALKFYASMRVDIRRTGQIKVKDEVVGNETRFKIVKNKLAAPFKSVDTSILYGVGFDQATELLEMAVEDKLVDKRGTWFVYKNTKLGQGKAAAAEYLRENAELFDEVLNRINN